ncbi:MAG: DUF2207 family protein [Candidatus Saccharimonadaceae bacterium]
MKRILGAVAAVLLVIGLLPIHSASAQSTNNFRISTYGIQYELSRDSESRSVLKTSETINAEFPTTNQNHGIERAIPSSYDGHSVDVTVSEVSDGAGKTLSYSTYSSNGNTVLRIGDADTYVHGAQAYHIVYTQRDVTRFYQDTGRDEWYWDTNGTQWQVPIDTLNVSMKIDPSIVGQRVGEPACYQGASGVTNTCKINTNDDGSYVVQATNLTAGENVTVAFGFNQGTFAQYKMSTFEAIVVIWGFIQFLMAPLAIGLTIAFAILFSRRNYRAREQNPIVAEYIPPKDASVMVASQVITVKQSAFTAQLIDLAVRHFISIVETKTKSLWGAAKYDIVIASDLKTLHEEEKEIISDMFGHLPEVGERLALSELKNNMSYSMRTLDNDKKLKILLNDVYAIREKSAEGSKFFYKWATISLVVAILTLTPMLAGVALIIFILGYLLRPLTDKGLELRRYVLGLDKYIKASETERLAFLQGPDTAQKVGYDVDPNNPGQVVKLYERVLPYAILFGREKEWSKRLGEFYEQSSTQPDWYSGHGVFNAAVFASTMNSFSQASSYSAGSSSSSGGSSGGGSSGGGGGGGGGGGW